MVPSIVATVILSAVVLRSNTMAFDVGFQKLDLIALQFDDVFDQVTISQRKSPGVRIQGLAGCD
jgi:hypothetical protein